jgi:phosphatidylglycerol:prolipoprotein diacylglycerol transferase
VLDFVLFAVLSVYATHTKKDGRVAALYLIFYSIGRYIVEMFRGDLARGNVGVFSTSQFISLFLLAAGIVLFVVRGKEKLTLEEEE